MSTTILAQQADTRNAADLLRAGGRLVVQGSDDRGFAATITDPDGEPIHTAFAGTIEGALRQLQLLSPLVLFGPGDRW
jgi:hypothetical protein